MIAALKADELSDAPVGSALYGALVTSMPLEHALEPSAEVTATQKSIASTVTTDAACVYPDALKTAIITAGSELTSQKQVCYAGQINDGLRGCRSLKA